MEIKHSPKDDELVAIQSVPLGSVFTIVSSINNSLYLRVHDGVVNLNGGYIHKLLPQCRKDACAKVLKATLTVEG